MGDRLSVSFVRKLKGNDMLYRCLALALSAISAATMLCGQQMADGRSSAPMTPYTAHLTITTNPVLPDGSSLNTISTEVLARDRQGRTYQKTEKVSQNGQQRSEFFWYFVQDPAKLQTLTWDSKSQTVVLEHWPFWSGREGCWADEHGQQPSRFGDRYEVPALPTEGKSETIASIADPSGKQVKTRVVTENLGQKEIHGLTAYGIGATRTPLENSPYALPETTSELWKSRELDLKLLEIIRGPKYGLKRVELTDLQRGDPDPALFEPPQGYTVQTVEYHPVACQSVSH